MTLQFKKKIYNPPNFKFQHFPGYEEVKKKLIGLKLVLSMIP